MKSASRKAPGPDDVAAELLRFGGEMTVTRLFRNEADHVANNKI